VVAPLSSAENFIDATLTTNLCPFRSVSKATLHRRKESLAFADNLWAEIFASAQPSVVLANGKDAGTLFEKTLTGVGHHVVGREQLPIGWGDYTYAATSLRRDPDVTLLVGLPHLSRFDILDPGARSVLVQRIASAVS